MPDLLSYSNISRRPPDVEDYIDILRRYRSWVIGPTFAALVISVVVAFWWPDMYVCFASMQIKPGAVPDLASASAMRMATRLQNLQLEILSRDNLITMLKDPKLDLYKKERGRLPDEDVAEEYFHKAVKISLISSDTENRGAQAFRISFAYPDKIKARAVVLALVTQFQNKNYVLQTAQASSANTLYDYLVKTARDKMEKANQAITAFSTEFQGRLPENFQSNMLEVQAKTAMLSNINDQISQERQHRALLESNLNNNKAQQLAAEPNLTTTVQTNSNPTVTNQRLITLDTMIATKKTELQALLKRWKENFPDVQTAKSQIADLEEQRAAVLKEEAANGAGRPNVVAQTVRNPEGERQMTNLKAQENDIKASIAASELQIQNKERQAAQAAKELKDAQDKVAASPALTQKFNQLQEDLTLARNDYQLMSTKKDASETQQSMEEHRAGETLEMLEQPITPETPASPVRGAIVGIGTVMGLVVGFVLAGAKEIKNTSLKNLKDVRAYTNLPVLSSIPLLENALLVRRKRRLAWLAWSSAIIIGSILMSGAMYYHYVLCAAGELGGRIRVIGEEMSRVHDALRRAELGGGPQDRQQPPARPDIPLEYLPVSVGTAPAVRLNIHPGMLADVEVVKFDPAPESHLLDLNNSHETPAEEFRTLRTRLNHLQTLQPLHTAIVTSPSPAEGKTFTAVNLALAEAQLTESSVLLGDFDLRRPIVHNLFQINRSPGNFRLPDRPVHLRAGACAKWKA